MSDTLRIQATPVDAAPFVLCVDDEEITLRLVGRLLEGMGLRVAATSSPSVAVQLFESETFDLVITDIRMPGMDGHAFLEAIRARDPQVPIVVATGYATIDNAMRALRGGATGMLIKPFTAAEFATEIAQALERARLRRDALRYRFVTPILDGVALALSTAIEARHLETGEHCRQLGHLGERLATILGLDERSRTTIRIGGFLHDVGKIGISDAVLLKAGLLTDAEFAEMRRHPEIGAAIVATHEGMDGIARIVRHHHERWDGAGYPDHLVGEEIPIGARIISVVDAFSAMTTDRVYRRALEPEQAWAELRRHAGSQFDPGVVELFEIAVDLSPELIDARLADARPGRQPAAEGEAPDGPTKDAAPREPAGPAGVMELSEPRHRGSARIVRGWPVPAGACDPRGGRTLAGTCDRPRGPTLRGTCDSRGGRTLAGTCDETESARPTCHEAPDATGDERLDTTGDPTTPPPGGRIRRPAPGPTGHLPTGMAISRRPGSCCRRGVPHAHPRARCGIAGRDGRGVGQALPPPARRMRSAPRPSRRSGQRS